MSEGFHAKISMFWRRNSTSSLFYLLFKLEPTLTCFEESPGTRSTFLVSWADLNDGSWSETCFFVVCISSRFMIHCKCIYIFLCSMLVYYEVLYVLFILLGVFIDFLPLTY